MTEKILLTIWCISFILSFAIFIYVYIKSKIELEKVFKSNTNEVIKGMPYFICSFLTAIIPLINLYSAGKLWFYRTWIVEKLTENNPEFIPKEDNAVYFITTLKIKDDVIIHQRTVGYLKSEKAAIDAVSTNMCDLYECGYYDYAVIERIEPGFYNYDENKKWFKWSDDRQTFCPDDCPDCLKDYTSMSIG